MTDYSIQLLEKEISREKTIIALKPLEKYDDETNEAIEYLKELSIKRITDLEKALKILKCSNACL